MLQKEILKNKADICQFNYFFDYENQQLKRENFSQNIIIIDDKKRKDIQCNVLAYRYAKNNKNIEYFGSIRGCWNKIFSKEFLEKNNIFYLKFPFDDEELFCDIVHLSSKGREKYTNTLLKKIEEISGR